MRKIFQNIVKALRCPVFRINIWYGMKPTDAPLIILYSDILVVPLAFVSIPSDMRTAKCQISLHIQAIWSEVSLEPWRNPWLSTKRQAKTERACCSVFPWRVSEWTPSYVDFIRIITRKYSSCNDPTGSWSVMLIYEVRAIFSCCALYIDIKHWGMKICFISITETLPCFSGLILNMHLIEPGVFLCISENDIHLYACWCVLPV